MFVGCSMSCARFHHCQNIYLVTEPGNWTSQLGLRRIYKAILAELLSLWQPQQKRCFASRYSPKIGLFQNIIRDYPPPSVNKFLLHLPAPTIPGSFSPNPEFSGYHIIPNFYGLNDIASTKKIVSELWKWEKINIRQVRLAFLKRCWCKCRWSKYGRLNMNTRDELAAIDGKYVFVC